MFFDENLILNKEKTVAFFTKHVFTTGHTSSLRSESLNSFFKGFEAMKREMTTWNVSNVYIHKYLLKFVMSLTRQFLPVDIGLSGLTKFGTRIVIM